MPNRLLRDWTDSLRLADISAEGERLFTRIIMKADDYGRFHADPRLLISACFPYDQQITPAAMGKWLRELENKGLVVVYEVGPRKFLAIVSFGQRLRGDKSKFPPPPQHADNWLPSFESGSDPAATRRHPPQPAADGGDARGGPRRKAALVVVGDGDGVVCGDEDEREVEPSPYRSEEKPRGFKVPTLQQVLAAADRQGVPPDAAEKFFGEMESVGWINKHGHPLVSWQPALRSYGVSWRGNETRFMEASGGGSGENGRENKPPANKPADLTPEQQAVVAANAQARLGRMLE